MTPTSRNPLRNPLKARKVGKPANRMFIVVVGLAGIFGLIGMIALGYNSPNNIPGRSYYNIEARFRDAGNLSSHYDVRMGGRRIGQVLRPRVDKGVAVFDLQLSGDLRLRSDTRLRVRPRSLLGVRYVDVTPGTRGRILREGETIPEGQTTAPRVELDDVLGIFDHGTRRRAGQLLRELGGGLGGRGEEASAAIGSAPGALRDIGAVSRAITARPGAAGELVRSADTLTAALDPVRGALAQGFAPEARALRPFKKHDAALRATLERAPGTLAALRGGLPSAQRLVSATGGLARDGRAALAAAPAALRETTRLLRDAKAPLRSADETLELAQRSVDPTLSLLRTVRPLLPALDTMAGAVAPITEQLEPHGCDLAATFSGWADMTKWTTPLTSLTRVEVASASPETAFGKQRTLLPDGRGGDRVVFQTPYPPPCEAEWLVRPGTGEIVGREVSTRALVGTGK